MLATLRRWLSRPESSHRGYEIAAGHRIRTVAPSPGAVSTADSSSASRCGELVELTGIEPVTS